MGSRLARWCAVFMASFAIVAAQGTALAQDDVQTFSELIEDLEPRSGFLNLYIDSDKGDVYAALPAPDENGVSVRFIYTTGLTSGLGSNPIGLDRSAMQSGLILRFRKIGDQIIAEHENWRYRATADRERERRSVTQSFANSFVWSQEIEATAADGRLLVNLSDFLTRDAFGLASQLKFGPAASAYKLNKDRSFPDTQNSLAFPDNVEIDAFLTFETDAPNQETRAAAADARAVTLNLHHSFIRLPDAGFDPRPFDPRTANMGFGYYDFSAPLDAPLITQLSRRFRLERVDPATPAGPVRKPIVFYVDPGAPKDIQDALIEGASWWARGFEAAGFEDAYRVELLPEGAHPLDIRYNVINWVHRQTRGWSYGGSVVDPRTGEILKANVVLGSQRVRQDRMIFEGLSSASLAGTGAPDDPVQIALARIRQLAAHEVGHTLGFAHNFAASAHDRASVMDYPAPFIRPTPSGDLDFSNTYASGLGPWDVFTVRWLYSQYTNKDEEAAALDRMVADVYASGLRYVADRDARGVETAHPNGSVWDNGADPIAMLDETMAVRRIALDRFGLDTLKPGQPQSDLNAIIAPIYLYHRYQVAAAAKVVGGFSFQYGLKGDGLPANAPASSDQQRGALAALLRTLAPEQLDLSDRVLHLFSPAYASYVGPGGGPEVLPSQTGATFDLLTASDVASSLTLSALLHPARAARLVEFSRQDAGALSLEEVLARVEQSVFNRPEQARLQPISHVVQARFVDELITLANKEETTTAVRFRVEDKLSDLQTRLGRRRAAKDDIEAAHFALLIRKISQHLDREAPSAPPAQQAPNPPPGSPIGAMGTDEMCWHCATPDLAKR